MTSLRTKHLLGIRELNQEDIRLILNTATHFKEVINRSIKKVPTLRDITIANIFFENSTRTKLSFELAEKRLSADILNFSSSSSSVKKGETLLDTIQNILAMKVDMIVIRHGLSGVPHFLSKHIQVPIINAGDGIHEHPTQALLDMFTIEERYSSLKGLKITIIGDVLHSRVALSNIFLFKKMGAHITICGPATLIPKYIETLDVEVSYCVEEALMWCDVAYVLRIQLERQQMRYFPSLREYSLYFGLNNERLSKLKKNITILHPGPINRGIEITSDVAASQHALILDQVENGVAVRMSILYLLTQQNMINYQ